MQAKYLLRYRPHTIHSLSDSLPAGICALMYVEHRSDVFGWYAQARRMNHTAAFFMIENFYAEHATRMYRSEQADVQGSWRREVPLAGDSMRCPLPEPFCHELERLHSSFVEEWLFFPGDPAHRAEVEEYRTRTLPLHAFNIRPRRLRRLQRDQDGWSHDSAGSDQNILDFLQKTWRVQGQELFLYPGFIPTAARRRYDELVISSTKKGRH